MWCRCQIMVIQAIERNLAFTLTEMGSHWKVFDVKHWCDLTYILKDHSGCSADNWLLKYYCSNSQTIAIVQVRADNSGLDQVGSSGYSSRSGQIPLFFSKQNPQHL